MVSTSSKKKLLVNLRLYVILDKNVLKRRFLAEVANKIKNSATAIIQLRDKRSKKSAIFREAVELRKLLSKSGCLFIVNDYIDIAKIADADGLHLGQGDTSIEIARKILGKDKLIGVSCHNLKEAQRAQKEGADYLGIGPVFSTPLKPKSKPLGLDLLCEIKRKIKIPFFVLGGIDTKNLQQILSRGIKRVAICRAITQARNIPLAVRNFSRALQ